MSPASSRSDQSKAIFEALGQSLKNREPGLHGMVTNTTLPLLTPQWEVQQRTFETPTFYCNAATALNGESR